MRSRASRNREPMSSSRSRRKRSSRKLQSQRRRKNLGRTTRLSPLHLRREMAAIISESQLFRAVLSGSTTSYSRCARKEQVLGIVSHIRQQWSACILTRFVSRQTLVIRCLCTPGKGLFAARPVERPIILPCVFSSFGGSFCVNPLWDAVRWDTIDCRPSNICQKITPSPSNDCHARATRFVGLRDALISRGLPVPVSSLRLA